jgi:ABC-type dipeptide/oligopeptide/nickel transport system ATPase component
LLEHPILSVRGLKTWFVTPAGITRAVDDVGFDVNPVDIVAIIGESGSGKTVTALSILKLVQTPPGRYVAGKIELDQLNILELNERELESVRGEKVGMIFQSPRAALDPSFTTESQLAETFLRHAPTLDRKSARTRARAALIEVGFPEPERVLVSYPHQLSGGMCQRICLAMALACKPKLLIADEPTTALDVGVQAKILLLLKRRNRESGLPIVVITHDIGVVRAIGTPVIVMSCGGTGRDGVQCRRSVYRRDNRGSRRARTFRSRASRSGS